MTEAKAAYDDLLARADAARAIGEFSRAIECGVRAWEHVEGMMRHDIKYLDQSFDSLACVDLVLDLAPVLFHHAALTGLERLLSERKWIEKQTSDSLASRLQAARERMRRLHLLWAEIEANPGTTENQLAQALRTPAEFIRSALADWQLAGLIEIGPGPPPAHYLVTHLRSRWRAKCPSCGRFVIAAKRVFLDAADCPGCHQRGMFVLVQSERALEQK